VVICSLLETLKLCYAPALLAVEGKEEQSRHPGLALILLAPKEVPAGDGSPVSDTCALGRGPKPSRGVTHSECLSAGNSICAAVLERARGCPRSVPPWRWDLLGFSWLALTSAEPHQLEGRLLEETGLSSAFFPNKV